MLRDRPFGLTADEIVADLEDADLERSRRTVYRALGDLLERGAVTKEGRTGRGGRVEWRLAETTEGG